MEVIWAPWRAAYIEAVKKEGCIFCDTLEERDPRSSLVLARTEDSVVMLNKYPYNNGHLLVAPKRHASRLDELSAQEFRDLSETLRASVSIVLKALGPGGVNLGMNLGRCAGAGVEHHLHWHVVPRWEGDTNFMPVVAEVRVISQHLLETYDRLSPYFKEFLLPKDAEGH